MRVSEPVPLPDRFSLHIYQSQSDYPKRHAIALENKTLTVAEVVSPQRRSGLSRKVPEVAQKQNQDAKRDAIHDEDGQGLSLEIADEPGDGGVTH